MVWRARLFFIALGLIVLFFVISSLRTKKLKEQYALLWLLMALALVVAPLFIDLVDVIAFAIGIDYPPALMIVIALVCFVLIFFQFSLTISRFSEQIKSLSQDLALTRRRLQDLEEKVSQGEQGLLSAVEQAATATVSPTAPVSSTADDKG